MAFTSGRMDDESGTPQPIGGNLYVVFGWFKNGALDEGGDIFTSFSTVHSFHHIAHVNAVGHGMVTNEVVADVEVVMGGTVTIITDASEDGRWMAIGN